MGYLDVGPARAKTPAEREANYRQTRIEKQLTVNTHYRYHARDRKALLDSVYGAPTQPNRESVQTRNGDRIVITPPAGHGDAWSGG